MKLPQHPGIARQAAFWIWLLVIQVLAWGVPPKAAAAFPKRPYVLLNQEELNHLRGELAQPGWKRELYRTARGFAVMNSGQGVRANADLWLKRSIEIPAYGGHFHQFFCVEGDRLELPTDQRFVPGPYKCPHCGKTYAGKQFEGALRRIVHGWLSQAALDLALVSALEQKPDYAIKAAEILLKYAEAYPGPHTTATTGGMIYQSLDEAMWIIPLAQAYDLICTTLPAAERARVEKFLRTVALGLERCGARGNWQSWHLSAVGVVGYAIQDESLVDYATKEFKRQIREELGDDGLWPESVHTYHYFPLMAFTHFAEAAWHAGVDLYHWEGKPGKSLLSMFCAPLQYAYPDLRLPAINDGWFEAFVPADAYELAYYRTRDPRFAWVLANGYKPGIVPAGLVAAASRNCQRDGFYAFLFGRDIPARTTPPATSSVNFPILGICALRSAHGAMLTFDYGPFLGHGQPDKMGITLFANHKLWMADYGTPGYGATILSWYKSTLAHNTLIVDGQNQKATKENNVKLWLGGSDLEAAQSETREAYPGVSHTRTVVRLEDTFVIVDRLQSSAEHTYDLYLHSEGQLSLDDQSAPDQSVKSKSPVPWIEDFSASPTPAPAFSGRWLEGGSGVAFWVGGTEPVTRITGKCPAETGSRKIPLLIARQQGQIAEFITVLVPYQGKVDLSVKREGSAISIQQGNSTEVLTLPEDGRRPSVTRKAI